MGFSLFNKNWRDYLKGDEQVVAHCGVNRFICVWDALKPIFAVSFWELLLIIGSLLNKSSDGVLSVSPVLLIFGIVWSVGKFLRLMGMQFVLTPDGIYKISGVISKNVKYVPFKKITDVQIMRTMMEQFVGVGSVGVATASGGNMINGKQLNELTVVGVEEYKKINEYIFKKIK